MKYICLIFSLIFLFTACMKPPLLKEGEEAEVFDGFEGDFFWTAVGDQWGDGDGSKSVKVVTEKFSEGKLAMESIFEIPAPATGSWPGAAFYNQTLPITDWSGFKAVGVDVYNPDENGLRVAFAICTGETWSWQETEAQSLKKGWNYNLRFNLMNKNLKSEAVGWEHKADLEKASEVKRIIFKFFPTKDEENAIKSSVIVDNIRLVK